MQSFTPDFISIVLGVVLSLCAAYVPGFSEWFASLAGNQKRLLMGGGMVAIAVLVVAATCAGWAADLGIYGTECSRPGLIDIAWQFVLALIGNQTAYTFAVRKPAPFADADQDYPL